MQLLYALQIQIWSSKDTNRLMIFLPLQSKFVFTNNRTGLLYNVLTNLQFSAGTENDDNIIIHLSTYKHDARNNVYIQLYKHTITEYNYCFVELWQTSLASSQLTFRLHIQFQHWLPGGVEKS